MFDSQWMEWVGTILWRTELSWLYGISPATALEIVVWLAAAVGVGTFLFRLRGLSVSPSFEPTGPRAARATFSPAQRVDRSPLAERITAVAGLGVRRS